jgi:hypothetical protein
MFRLIYSSIIVALEQLKRLKRLGLGKDRGRQPLTAWYKYDGDVTPPSPFHFCNVTFLDTIRHGDTMSRLFLIGGAICLAGAFCSYSTEQGLGVTIMLGFIGGIFVIIGLAGGKP